MITITLTGEEANDHIQLKGSDVVLVEALGDKLEAALMANKVLQDKLNHQESHTITGHHTAKTQDFKTREAKRMMDDIEADAPSHFKPKAPKTAVKPPKVPAGMTPGASFLKNWPLEPFMIDIMKKAEGKTTATATTKYLCDRSKYSMTTFRKAVKMLGFKSKGGFLVKNK